MSGETYLQDRCLTSPWYELYDGAKPLVVGHRNYLAASVPLLYPLGARPARLWPGYRLRLRRRAHRLDPARFPPDQRASRANHWQDLQREYDWLGGLPDGEKNS